MKNWNKYFNAPVYESSKSSYSLRFQTEFERSLMKLFDANTEITDYFQPLMEISMDGQLEETWLRIDFWLECNSGKTILVHVVNEHSFDEPDNFFKQAKTFCRSSNFELLVLCPAGNHLMSTNETVQALLLEA